MPKRFEAYRMRDGETPLSEDFFNAVFGDIDTRIAELEARRADWQGVIDELTSFGLQRIDALVGPSMAEVNAMLVQLRQRRDELEAAIGNVGDLATKSQLQSAIAQEQTDRTAEAHALSDRIEAVKTTAQGKVGSVNGVAGDAITLKPSHLNLGPANGPTAVALVRDAQGRLSQVTSTVDGKPCVQTLAYDGAGVLTTVTTVHDGRQRVQTLTYEGGALKSVAAVETVL